MQSVSDGYNKRKRRKSTNISSNPPEPHQPPNRLTRSDLSWLLNLFLRLSHRQHIPDYCNEIGWYDIQRRFKCIYVHDITPSASCYRPTVKKHSREDIERLNVVINHYIIVDAFMG